MTKTEVISLLEKNQNERGIANWQKLGDRRGDLDSFGIGLTQLRKLSKKIGRDPGLSAQLWKSNNHDAKVVALLIDDPKQLTREQIEAQVEEVAPGMLAHVFSSCDATLPKASFAFDLATEWMESPDPLRRQCAYGVIYELSKKQGHADMTDEFCLACLERIDHEILDEVGGVRGGMSTALMGIGKRNRRLNQAAIKVAKRIGPVTWDDETECEPFDVLKHLTAAHLREKLG